MGDEPPAPSSLGLTAKLAVPGCQPQKQPASVRAWPLWPETSPPGLSGRGGPVVIQPPVQGLPRVCRSGSGGGRAQEGGSAASRGGIGVRGIGVTWEDSLGRQRQGRVGGVRRQRGAGCWGSAAPDLMGGGGGEGGGRAGQCSETLWHGPHDRPQCRARGPGTEPGRLRLSRRPGGSGTGTPDPQSEGRWLCSYRLQPADTGDPVPWFCGLILFIH